MSLLAERRRCRGRRTGTRGWWRGRRTARASRRASSRQLLGADQVGVHDVRRCRPSRPASAEGSAEHSTIASTGSTRQHVGRLAHVPVDEAPRRPRAGAGGSAPSRAASGCRAPRAPSRVGSGERQRQVRAHEAGAAGDEHPSVPSSLHLAARGGCRGTRRIGARVRVRLFDSHEGPVRTASLRREPAHGAARAPTVIVCGQVPPRGSDQSACASRAGFPGSGRWWRRSPLSRSSCGSLGFHESLFADEIYSYRIVANYGFLDVVREVHDTAITPPLHYLLAHGAVEFGDDATWIRMPSIVLGAATVPLVYLLGTRTVGRTAGLFGGDGRGDRAVRRLLRDRGARLRDADVPLRPLDARAADRPHRTGAGAGSWSTPPRRRSCSTPTTPGSS